MTTVAELLPLYVLGVLDDADTATVERALADDPSLAGELDACLEVIAVVTPAPDILDQLLASTGGGRYEAFAHRLASLFDVTLDRARELLGLIERKAAWEQPVPGIHLVHVTGGPACAAADCGFVRVDPGCTFPWHTHRGEEISIVLAGSLRDSHDGRVYVTGDELTHAANSVHELTAGDAGALYIARAMNGIEVSGRRQ